MKTNPAAAEEDGPMETVRKGQTESLGAAPDLVLPVTRNGAFCHAKQALYHRATDTLLFTVTNIYFDCFNCVYVCVCGYESVTMGA